MEPNYDLLGAIFGIQSQEDWDDDLNQTHRRQAEQAQEQQQQEQAKEESTTMATCQFTNEEFIPRKDQPKWTKMHPAIKDAYAAMIERHPGNHQHLYMSAADQALAGAAPFALTDVDRVMAMAEAAAARSEQELRAYFGETESEALPMDAHAGVHLSE